MPFELGQDPINVLVVIKQLKMTGVTFKICVKA